AGLLSRVADPWWYGGLRVSWGGIAPTAPAGPSAPAGLSHHSSWASSAPRIAGAGKRCPPSRGEPRPCRGSRPADRPGGSALEGPDAAVAVPLHRAAVGLAELREDLLADPGVPVLQGPDPLGAEGPG